MKFLNGIVAFTLIGLGSFQLNAQQKSNLETALFASIQPEQVGVASESLDFLKNEITSWVKQRELVGGEVLIVKDGYAIFHEAFGWYNKEQKIPMTLNKVASLCRCLWHLFYSNRLCTFHAILDGAR